MLHSVPRHFVRAVSLYRSKFTDCLGDAVPNSYPKLDLPWDNIIAGHWGWPRKSADSKSRPVAYPSAGRDTLRYANRVNFQLSQAIPRWRGSVCPSALVPSYTGGWQVESGETNIAAIHLQGE